MDQPSTDESHGNLRRDEAQRNNSKTFGDTGLPEHARATRSCPHRHVFSLLDFCHSVTRCVGNTQKQTMGVTQSIFQIMLAQLRQNDNFGMEPLAGLGRLPWGLGSAPPPSAKNCYPPDFVVCYPHASGFQGWSCPHLHVCPPLPDIIFQYSLENRPTLQPFFHLVCKRTHKAMETLISACTAPFERAL